jgi:hypothetical protein
MYKVKLNFTESLNSKQMMLVWNLFQIYAAVNDSVPHGRLESEGYHMTINVIIKRRLGLPRNSHPLR